VVTSRRGLTAVGLRGTELVRQSVVGKALYKRLGARQTLIGN